MNLIAILSGVLVGFTLGLVGGGGSVLATPLLLYAIVGLPPHVAIGTGAFAVSVNAFLNFFAQVRSGRIIWKSAIVFAVFGSLGAFVGSSLGKAMNGDALIFLFGLAMLGVGAAMLRPIEPKLDAKGKVTASATKSALVAIGVGVLAGFFGIGGGVLIVPGLVLATRMPMLNAISTSLLAVGSFGLTTAVNYAASGLVAWAIAAQFIGGGLLGGFLGIEAGVYLSRYKGALNKAFAALTFAVASYVLYRSGSAIYAPQRDMPQIARSSGVEAPQAPLARAVEDEPTATGKQAQPAPPSTEEANAREKQAEPAILPQQEGSRIDERAATAQTQEAGSTSGDGDEGTARESARVTRPDPGTSGSDADTGPRKHLEPDVPSRGGEGELLAFLSTTGPRPGGVAWFDFDGLRFGTGKATLPPGSHAQLRAIAEILSTRPDARVIIAGHTDAIGNARKNRRVSMQRAEYVLRELTRMGVDASRLEARGYAGELPVAPNSSAEGRAKNRRVSLGVIQEE